MAYYPPFMAAQASFYPLAVAPQEDGSAALVFHRVQLAPPSPRLADLLSRPSVDPLSHGTPDITEAQRDHG